MAILTNRPQTARPGAKPDRICDVQDDITRQAASYAKFATSLTIWRLL